MIEWERIKNPSEVPFVEMAEAVEDYLGADLTAYISFGDPELPRDQQTINSADLTRLINQQSEPTDEVKRRLTHAFEVLQIFVAATEDPNVIRAWFTNVREDFYDVSAAEFILQDPDTVKQAANDFIETDYYFFA